MRRIIELLDYLVNDTTRSINDRESIARALLPSGGGFDNGFELNIDKCKPGRIVLSTAFHHMDEHGGYVLWTNHKVVLTPSFQLPYYDIKVSGSNAYNIKSYIAETIDYRLQLDIDYNYIDDTWRIIYS